jgi:di/tricarboxylate transporter
MVIGYILVLLIGAVVLFSLEKLSVDLITLLLLIALIVPGILTPAEAFAGFSNEIIVILASIFVVSAALKDAGVLDWIGSQMQRAARVGTKRFLFGMMSVVGSTSAFMNNTTVTALFTPLVAGLGRRAGVSPSKLLMPVAFASILGGTCTLIGTSTNVAVSGYLAQAGFAPVGMFEITPMGVIVLAVGMTYMVFAGTRLLPDNGDGGLTEDFAIRQYLSEIVVLPDSPLIGQKISDSDLSILDFNVLNIVRRGEVISPTPDVRMEEGDILIVIGKVSDLVKVRKIEGIDIRADRKMADHELSGRDMRIAEVLVGQPSEAAGRTLQELDFRRRLAVSVLAICRHGRPVAERMNKIRLQTGDVLLVQARPSRLAVLQENFGMPVLDEVNTAPLHQRRGLLVLGIFISAVACGSLGAAPLSACFLVAAVACTLIGAVNIERAYQFIDWKLLILIGGMTAFGSAMEKTGTAAYLSHLVTDVFGALGPRGILAGFFVLTILLTQPMSNAAAALVVLPVALKTAELTGANPRTFGIGVMLAASVSFIAPLEPSCILVYGPGRYRFWDFVKNGLGLTLVLSVVVLLLLPVFWPL